MNSIRKYCVQWFINLPDKPVMPEPSLSTIELLRPIPILILNQGYIASKDNGLKA